jgi:FlaG/FlaF family flagellin (archaellin)
MKVFKQSTQALSPVIASVMLIAIAVAVTLATSGWLGGLTTKFEETEQIKITSVNFTPTSQYLNIVGKNTGPDSVTIKEVWINNVNQAAYSPNPTTVRANTDFSINVTLTQPWSYGYSYQIKLLSSRANPFFYAASPP